MNKVIVVEPSAGIRRLARQALRGYWKTGILTMLLLQLVVGVPILLLSALFPSGLLARVEDLYMILISAPLALGLTMVFLNIFRQKDTGPMEIFYGFEFMFKAIGLRIVSTFFIIMWTFLLIVPGIMAAYRYRLAFYILADDPKKGIFQCINESKYLMGGNKSKMFCLDFSFIGWSLLCTIPVAIFSTVFSVSMADNMLSQGVSPAEMTLAIQSMPSFKVGVFVASLGYLILAPYVNISTICLYDLINGNLTVRRVASSGSEAGETQNPVGQVYEAAAKPSVPVSGSVSLVKESEAEGAPEADKTGESEENRTGEPKSEKREPESGRTEE